MRAKEHTGAERHTGVPRPGNDQGGEDPGCTVARDAADERRDAWVTALRSTCDHTPHLAGMLDVDGTVLHANAPALALGAVDLDAVVGKPLWEGPWFAHSAEERERARDAVGRAAERAVEFPSTHLAPDGSLRTIDNTIWPVRDEAGRTFLMIAGRDVTDRRRARDELQATNDLLHAIIDATPVAIAGLDLDGIVRSVWNRAAERMLGWTAEEAIGRFLPSVQAEKEEEFEEFRRRIRAGMTLDGVEVVRRRKDGCPIDYSIYASPLHDRDGNISGNVAVMVDITQRKAAEEALRAKTEELERYFANAIDLLCIADTDGYFRRLNPEWEATLGYRVDELEGTPFLDYVHPDDRVATLDAMRRLGEGQEVLEFSNRYRASDGSYRWIEWRSFPAGNLIYAVARDVTERRTAEDLLRANYLRLQAMVRNAPVAIYAVDRDGVFTLSEGRALYAMGLIPGAIVGRSAFDVYRDQPEDYEHFVRALAGERFTALIHAGPHTLEAYHEPLFDAEGRYDGTIGVIVDITERLRVEEELERSRLFLDTILEHSPLSMWVSDETGTLIRMNQACRDLLGVTDEDLVGRYNVLEDNVVEQQGAIPLVRRVFDRGERVQFVLRYDSSRLRTLSLSRTKRLVLLVTISPILDPDGHVIHAIVQHEDITEQTRAQEALAGVNRRLRMLSDCNQALIRGTDEASLLQAVCSIIVEVGGYRMATVAFPGDDDRPLVPVAFAGPDEGRLDDRLMCRHEEGTGSEPLLAAYRTGAPVAVRGIADDGHPGSWRRGVSATGYASVCGLPLSAGGAIIGTLGVFSASVEAFDEEEIAHLTELAGDLAYGIVAIRNRAERERAEASLRETDERFRRLLLNSGDLIGVADRSGTVTYVAGSLERTLGLRPEDVLGSPAFGRIHPDDLERARAAFVECAASPGAACRVQYRCRNAVGDWVWLEAVGANLIDDPIVHGVVLNIRDVTAWRAAEDEHASLQDQLQQATKMEAVGRLAGGIAHDFNNLLTAIAGNVELAKMELAPPDPLRRYLDEVSKATDSAASLIRQLLAFSRRQIVEPRVLDLNEVIGRLRTMLIRLIGEDVDLRFVPGADLGPVRMDPGQLEQVLVNLTVNARDAMPDGGTLTVETQNVELDAEYCAHHPNVSPGAFVVLAVTDTGHGMSDDVKQRLFEPFFTTKPMGRGTGLGLATIFGAVKQAGGNIEVYSEAGRGTTFRIYLPRTDEPAEELNAPSPPPTLPTGTETILLVEDDASVRELAQLILRRLGYTVLLASNGGEAFMLAEKHEGRIDLLLTDVVMPGVNGRELAERLLLLHPEMRVLFSSGYTEDVVVHHGVVDARANFIGKPFTMQALATKVRTALARG